MPELESFDIFDAMQELCRAKNKYGLYLKDTSQLGSIEETKKAAPYLNIDQLLDTSKGIFVLFNTKEEMEYYYNMTIGDDGPTELNPYNGIARIYAVTCSNEGQLENENT